MDNSKPISTSALAKKLGKSARQMFAELEALGWIRRVDDQWQLTAKGEFEQGQFCNSDKYGTYIVWPATVVEHRALVSPGDRWISASGIAKQHKLSTQGVNRLLAELGWITPHLKGWQVSRWGQAVGGEQREDPRSGVPYVMWPESLPDNAVFKRALGAHTQRLGAVETVSGCAALDGHLLRSEAEAAIDNWLYLAGVSHACRRLLPVEAVHHSDFYLPAGNLYIEYWGDSDAAYLLAKMHKKEIYRQHGLNLLELQEDDLSRLDEVLSRGLLKFGIET